MTVGLAAATAVLVVVLLVVLVSQRAMARRLVEAGRRIDPELVAGGSGLAAAASLVERAADRAEDRIGEATTSVHRLERGLGAIPAGVVLFDDDGRVSFRNSAAAAYLTARSGNALIEEAISDLAGAAASGEEPRARTVEVLGPAPRTVVVRATRLSVEGDAGGVLVVIDDISARRRLEAVRRDFVANISHELKTPVGALGLLAEAFVDEDDPAVAQRLARRMASEAARVGHTIDDLLELSRIEGEEGGVVEVLPVADVVAEALGRIQQTADQRGITLVVEPVDPQVTVAGDRLQLISAVANLVDNAVKYSDAGSAVEVRTHHDADHVEIAVRDHGVGIPRGDLDRIFERFYRVDRARSRATGGTGLGLAIVRHVAANHAGDVRVESQEGAGSTFTLRLPIEPRVAGDPDRGRMGP